MNLHRELSLMGEKYTPAHSKKWALEFLEKINPKLYSKIKSIKDSHFNNIGFVCKLNQKEIICSDEKLISRLEDLQRFVNEESFSPVPTKKPMKKINKNLYAIDEYIDQILQQKVTTPFVFASIDKNDISELKTFCEKNFDEIITYPEEFNVETIRELKNFYKEVLKKIKNFENPAPKKPSEPITLTPHQQTRDVLFEHSTIDGVKSSHPATIVGKKSAFVYDQKYRYLIQYIGIDDGFTFSGTTLKNVDLSKSSRKVVDFREVIKNKKNLLGLLSSLKTKEAIPGCRFSKNFIILESK